MVVTLSAAGRSGRVLTFTVDVSQRVNVLKAVQIRGVATGGIWGRNDVRMAIEHAY